MLRWAEETDATEQQTGRRRTGSPNPLPGGRKVLREARRKVQSAWALGIGTLTDEEAEAYRALSPVTVGCNELEVPEATEREGQV